ncbi:MAG: Flp pilus assembly protein CpaB [Planctomycetota bacterium]
MKKYIQSLGRTGLFACLALLLGALGVIASRMNQPTPPPPVPKLYDVPVATADLQVGRLIAKSDFYVQKLTAEQKKAAGFKDAHYSLGKDLTGRIVRTPIRKNQYFPLDSLYPDGTGPSISEKLRPGMRAVMIPVDAASITNLTTPDSYVDVLFRPATTPPSDGKFTLTGGRILERAQVLAVNQKWYAQTLPALQQDSHGGGGVTLAVTPEQAEMLKSLEPLGKFSLIAAPDAGAAPSGAIPDAERMKQILGLNDPSPPPEPVLIPTMELVRGGVITRVPLDSPIATSIPGDPYFIPAPGDVPMDLYPIPAGPQPYFYPEPVSGQMAPAQPAPGQPAAPQPVPQPTPVPMPANPPAPSPNLLNDPIPPRPMSSRNYGGKVRVSNVPSAGPVAARGVAPVPRKAPLSMVKQPTQVASARPGTSAAPRMTPVSRATAASTATASRAAAPAAPSRPAANVTAVRHVGGAVPAQKAATGQPPAPVVNRRTQPTVPRGPQPQVSAVWMRPATDPRIVRASAAFKSTPRR